MHLHILGICGTFMGSLAQLAKASGHHVTGSDLNVYPPMSTQLEAAGIELIEGFEPDQLSVNPDVVVVGNVVSRGNPVMEEVMNRGIPYISGPQWLRENILQHRWVLAVSGTHGKTTTSSMLAWILEYAGMKPGYLIGGVPGNFPSSARLGESDFFVIEADEYDTAFFDKRSKFVHYLPRTLIINNLEFDHADIFSDLSDIQTQFHHLLRTVPSNGQVMYPKEPAIEEVIHRGVWANTQTLGGEEGDWQIEEDHADGFAVLFNGAKSGEVRWSLSGRHNMQNALAAIAAARHVGVEIGTSCEALCYFKGVKRRLEYVGSAEHVRVYDDFAHHPTAIELTLEGLRNKLGDKAKIIAIIEPRSNTMKQGVHKTQLRDCVQHANEVLWFSDPALKWNLAEYVLIENDEGAVAHVCNSVDEIIARVQQVISDDDQETHVVIMSNGGFQNIHQRLLAALAEG